MSQDHLSIIVNAAVNRSKNMKLTDDGTNEAKFDPKQQAVDNSVRDLQEWSKASNNKDDNVFVRFFKSIFGGKSPQDAHDEAIKATNIQNNPKIMQAPEKGQLMMDAKGNKAMVYPDGHFEEMSNNKGQK